MQCRRFNRPTRTQANWRKDTNKVNDEHIKALKSRFKNFQATMILFGDSHFHLVQKHFPKHPIFAACRDATDNAIWRLDEGGLVDTLRSTNGVQKIKHVVVSLGASDIERGPNSNKDAMLENMVHIVSRFRSMLGSAPSAGSSLREFISFRDIKHVAVIDPRY